MPDATRVTKVYGADGGDKQVIASGGVFDVETGGALQIAGVDKTAVLAAAVAAPVAGVAAGYKVARGTVTPTSASHTVVTGLTTVVAVVVSFKGAPSLTHMDVAGNIGDQAGTPAAGSILITSTKPTATGNVTPIDATTPWSAIDWIAVGT